MSDGGPSLQVGSGSPRFTRSRTPRDGARWLLAGLVLAGCATRSAPVAAPVQPTNRAVPAGPQISTPNAADALAQAPPPACAEPAAVADRDAAVDALLEGRPLEATDRLEKLLRARPWDLAASRLHDAATALARDANRRAAERAAGMDIVELEAPPRAAPSDDEPDPAVGGASTIRLEPLSVAQNLITDDADWLDRYGPPAHVDPRTPPAHVASSFRGQDIASLFGHADHVVAVYGDAWLVCSAEGKQPRAFSLALSRDPNPLEIRAAQLAGDLLLLQLAYNGYAASSGGRNGYLAAFDARDGRLRWVSPPLSANLSRFVVVGRSVISGYGFTAEPDFVFNFDLDSGQMLQKLPVKSGPQTFSPRDDKLYLRTYDRDYVFTIAAPAGTSPPPAALAPAPPRSGATPDPGTGCRLRAAAAAIDARDPDAFEQALIGLRADGALDAALLEALERSGQHLVELCAGRRVDLWSRPPVAVAAPPWHHALLTPTGPLPTEAAPSLVKTSGRRADPIRQPKPAALGTGRAFFIAPVEDGKLPAGAPDVPTHYGLSPLRAIVPSGERLLLIYEGRYLAALREQTLEQVLDLDALRDPPEADPAWKEFASQDATHAQVVGDVLYVCNGGGSYAREVFGKKGFVTAIDLATGELRWRSDPLRCNSTLAVAGDYLATGYGFTAEPDFLFLLRLADGRTVARAKLDTGPDTVTVDGSRVHVEAYGHVYDFELR